METKGSFRLYDATISATLLICQTELRFFKRPSKVTRPYLAITASFIASFLKFLSHSSGAIVLHKMHRCDRLAWLLLKVREDIYTVKQCFTDVKKFSKLLAIALS